ncbi:MAG: hypothetical protein BWY61_00624 [Firmicutes bacterium ADurb.Bin354]|nr:MAG: hypothetical protein BWY61_00624 [Firmicutes bacterium ADurb.Bin354]
MLAMFINKRLQIFSDRTSVREIRKHILMSHLFNMFFLCGKPDYQLMDNILNAYAKKDHCKAGGKHHFPCKRKANSYDKRLKRKKDNGKIVTAF